MAKIRLKISFIETAWNYAKNYGKPDAGQPLNLSGIISAFFILLAITLTAFYFHAGFLCILLTGEYKEWYEHFTAYLRRW